MLKSKSNIYLWNKVLKQQQFQKKASKVCISPLCPIHGKWYVVNYINTCFQKLKSLSPSFLKHVYEGIIFTGAQSVVVHSCILVHYFRDVKTPGGGRAEGRVQRVEGHLRQVPLECSILKWLFVFKLNILHISNCTYLSHIPWA